MSCVWQLSQILAVVICNAMTKSARTAVCEEKVLGADAVQEDMHLMTARGNLKQQVAVREQKYGVHMQYHHSNADCKAI